MKIKFLIGLLIIGILISGCAEKECEIDADCSAKDCFTVQCTDTKCVYSPISDCCGNEICEVNEIYPECAADCPNCDDKNDCTVDEYDYHEQECVNTIIPNVICCGNKICETGETYETCAQDCPNCNDDNECTKDGYDYHKQECVNEVIIPCCGNEICDEDAETYSSCLTDCPNCDDGDKFTDESFNYTTQKCKYITYILFDDFEEGDLSGWDICTDCTGYAGYGWKVISEDDNKVVRGYGQNDMHSGLDSWTDYTFAGKFKIIEGCAGVWVREYTRPSGVWYAGRYQFLICDENKIVFTIEEYEIASTEKDRKGLSVPLNEWHDFKVVVKGSNLKFYFNGNLMIDANDKNNIFPNGRIGIGSMEYSDVYFDDLKVRES